MLVKTALLIRCCQERSGMGTLELELRAFQPDSEGIGKNESGAATD